MGRNRRIEFISSSPLETLEFGKTLANSLQPEDTVCFFGDLAAGKTTLIKGIIGFLTPIDINTIVSPTYVYMNLYEGFCSKIYHFDLYRLKGTQDFLQMGFEEYLNEGICLIEWSERITPLVSPTCIKVEIHPIEDEKREIIVTYG